MASALLSTMDDFCLQLCLDLNNTAMSREEQDEKISLLNRLFGPENRKSLQRFSQPLIQSSFKNPYDCELLQLALDSVLHDNDLFTEVFGKHLQECLETLQFEKKSLVKLETLLDALVDNNMHSSCLPPHSQIFSLADFMKGPVLCCFKKWAVVAPQEADKCAQHLVSMCIDNCNEESLRTLCLLADYVFASENRPWKKQLINDNNEFWKLLQYGFSHSSSTVRKETHYIFKLHVQGDAEEKKWEDLIVLLEALDETQVHVIKPVLKRFDTLHAFDETWALVVLQRAVNHDSTYIVKWALQKFCLTSWKQTEFVDSFIVGPLLNACTDSSLYTREDVRGSLCELGNHLEQFFNRYGSSSLLPRLLDAVISNSWGPVSLFHVLRAIVLVQEQECLDSHALGAIQSFVIAQLKTHNVYLRGAIQCLILEIVIKFSSTNDLKTLAYLFGVFSYKECFQDGCRSWTSVVSWLKMKSSKLHALSFVKDHKAQCSRSYVRMVLLLQNAGLLTYSDFLPSIDDAVSRMYIPNEDMVATMCYLSAFRLEAPPKEMDAILWMEKSECNLASVLHRMKDEVLDMLMKYLNIAPSVSVFLNNMTTSWPLSHRLRLLACVKEEHLDDKQLQMTIKSVVENTLMKDTFIVSADYKQNISCCWSVCKLYLQTQLEITYEGACTLTDIACDAIEISNKESLLPLLGCLKFLLPKVDLEVSTEILETSWKVIFEHRKSDIFLKAMTKLVEAQLQEDLVVTEGFPALIHKTGMQLLKAGEKIVSVYNIFIERLYYLYVDSHVSESEFESIPQFPFMDILTQSLLFGPVQRKDERILNDTYAYINSLGNSFATNVLVPCPQFIDASVRVIATKLALHLCARNDFVAKELVDKLLVQEKLETEKKSRFFGDSLTHRVKTRIMQALLVLEPYLNEECCEHLLMSVYEQLRSGSSQPSIRYMQEWLVTRILLHHQCFLDTLFSAFEKGSKERIGSICSLTAVAWHVALLENDTDFYEKCVRTILPFSMAQNFNVRLYAQMALRKLLNNLVKTDEHLKLKYNEIKMGLEKSVEQGNAVRLVEQMRTDFYYTVFDPKEHFTIQTIYYELPRLSNMSDDEWLPPELFYPFSCRGLPVHNTEKKLQSYAAASWIPKYTASLDDEQTECSNFQKKFTPWKMMVPDLEFLQSYPKKKKTPVGGLVVVASLIDRLPNLGGLCRSCEIFGASEYVLGSLKYTEEQLFQNLSVSAEKWVSVMEVKPHNLKEYLSAKKRKGYALIGAEQSADSVKLKDFKFPRQSLLLLGNEKLGIPAELLHLLDFCVEIPQHGVIRSLNVHVTGALFMWEYAHQHVLQ